MNYFCDDCHDTGWVGDNGPGRKGNNEYHECHCSFIPKSKEYPFEKVREFIETLSNKNPSWYSELDWKYFIEEATAIKQEITNAELPY